MILRIELFILQLGFEANRRRSVELLKASISQMTQMSVQVYKKRKDETDLFLL